MKWAIYEKCLEQCLAESKPSASVCGSNHRCHLYSHHHHHYHHHQHHLVITIITTLTLIIVAAIFGQVLVNDVDCQGW